MRFTILKKGTVIAMSKFKRHQKILEIIARETVATQEQLLDLLHAEGFAVTQATVSRDIRELRLAKVQTRGGAIAYAGAQSQEGENAFPRFSAIFREAVSKIDYAQNLIVVKCYNGMANAACAALDAVHWPNVVGTIAGDDTILIVVRDNDAAAALVEELHRLLEKPGK